MSARKVQVHVESLEETGKRVIDAWHAAEKGDVEPQFHVSFTDVATFMKVVSPRRVDLMKALRGAGPMSVRALSMLLKRDYKSVHGDVAKLLGIGLIDRTESGLVEVTWDKVSAELDLLAA
jgi:predicted transcriptional regulator